MTDVPTRQPINVVPFPEAEPEYYPAMPPRLFGTEWRGLLIWAARRGASDIRLQPAYPVMLQIHGKLVEATPRTLSYAEVEDAANVLYGADGMARIKSGQDFDCAYQIRPDRYTRLRFRVNAAGCEVEGIDTVSIVLRVLPTEPPRIESLGLEPAILAAYRVRKGIGIVSGGTENGKSTLLAAMIRAMIEDPEADLSILEYAAPIEFVQDAVNAGADQPRQRRRTMITQREVPRHIPSFHAAARQAMRANPKLCLLAECRDAETMSVACLLAIAGTALLTTIHAGSIAETIQRAVSLCPTGERAAVAVQLAQSLRFIINQRLVPSTDGRRTALREFLVFDDGLRRQLARSSPDDWPAIVQEALPTHGQNFTAAATRALAEGRIDESTMFFIKAEFGDVA